MIQQLYYPFYFGLGGTVGFKGDQWLPWIHVSDLAGIFVHAIKNDNVSGALNGTAESACHFSYTWICNELSFWTRASQGYIRGTEC